MDGDRLSSEDLKGKVVLIEFWATWCPYCRREQPLLEALQKDYETQGLVVIAVDMGEPKRKVKKYLEDNPRSAKIVMEEDTNLAAWFNAKAYPLYILINRDGEIAGRQNGASGDAGLRRLLRRAGLGQDDN